LNGIFNTCQLRAFEPREGTKLALAEAAWREAMDNNKELDEGKDEVEEEERVMVWEEEGEMVEF
jgi:hypothetical protein